MNNKYLLDSNICIYLLRNRLEVKAHIQQVGWENCCISEITVTENVKHLARIPNIRIENWIKP